MKRYLKIWRKPNGEMVSIPVRSRSGYVGQRNSYGWELVYIGSLTISKRSLFYGFDISKYIVLKIYLLLV